MNAKNPKLPRGASKSPAARTLKVRVDPGTTKRERDAFARQILDRMIPEFGPVQFTKADLFREMAKQPMPDELIQKLAAEAER